MRHVCTVRGHRNENVSYNRYDSMKVPVFIVRQKSVGISKK